MGKLLAFVTLVGGLYIYGGNEVLTWISGWIVG